MDPVAALAEQLAALGWVSDLWVGGSLASGDHVPGVSDLDLVAVVDGDLTEERVARLVGIHTALDAGGAAGAKLGCAYATQVLLGEWEAEHPTWTHGRLVSRALSGIVRAELARHGYAEFGRPPGDVLPPVADDDVRWAAVAELTGYWARTVRRPHYWLDPTIAELALTSMARGRHALETGQLLTKSAAIDEAAAPAWLVDQLRRRRRGEAARLPRLRTGWIAWRDAHRTTRAARAVEDHLKESR